MRIKGHVKFYHYLRVYLPVILITILILLVYVTYFLSYLLELLQTPEGANSLTPGSYYFLHTSSPTHAYKKGLFLLIMSLFLLTMLLISLYRTVFMDPGYLPNPTDLEFQIVERSRSMNLNGREEEKNKNKYKFLTNFYKTIQQAPMCADEQMDMRHQLYTFFNPLQLTQPSMLPKEDSKFYLMSNEEKIIKNKKDLFKLVNESNRSDLLEKDGVILDVFQNIELSKTNLCGTCLRLKVERSHHCRQCGRCILKMDHHCPWLGNCIGFRNYKMFVLLQFYGVNLSLLVATTFYEVIVNYNLNYYSNICQCWFLIFAYFTNIALLIFLLWLLLMNSKLIYRGETVIEQSDRERFPSSKAINVYDIGFWRNIKTIFGNNPTIWLLPFFPNYNGKGLIYETNDKVQSYNY